jgi:hypothetical protein
MRKTNAASQNVSAHLCALRGTSPIAAAPRPPYTPFSAVAPRKSDNREEGLARAEELLERLRFNRERIVVTIERARRAKALLLLKTRSVVPHSKG